MSRAPVTLLTGPRQAGKSTLARQVVTSSPAAFFDLEDPRDLARLAEPTLALDNKFETIVIDEAQRVPDLFPVLRVLVDNDRRPGRFVILGSASPDLVGLSSESLAGRVTLRDLANLGFRFPAATMRRFWTMLAHYHGQKWNGAEIARSIDVSESTVRRYVDALTDALVIRQLQPWFANISKRQVKAPRVYIRDSGLLHRLLGLGSRLDLERHPKLGASWEGMIIEQLLAKFDDSRPSYWSTQGGAELDLRIEIDGNVIGFEIKRTDRPSTSKSMHAAIADLELDHLVVAHSGRHRIPLTDKITAIGAVDLLTSDEALDNL